MPLSKNILIVDDDSIVLLILKEALKKLVKIDTCSNGIEELHLMALCNYPLVILDINMPYVNGIDLINFLERTNKINNTKFILIYYAMSDYKDIKLKIL